MQIKKKKIDDVAVKKPVGQVPQNAGQKQRQ